MSTIRFLARSTLSATFIEDGIETLHRPDDELGGSSDAAAQLAMKLGLTLDRRTATKLVGVAQTTAGCLLALGKLRRVSALVLLGSTVPNTYSRHRFWELSDPGERSEQRAHFLKNVGLIGGLVLELVDTEGAPSLGWRARRAATKARQVAEVRSETARDLVSDQVDRAAGALEAGARRASGVLSSGAAGAAGLF